MRILLRGVLLALLFVGSAENPCPIPERGPEADPTRSATAVLVRPRPTENVLDEAAEERNREGRERWIEEMHRTPPGVDWRAVERANGLARMERRNALAAGRDLRSGASAWLQLGSRNLAGRMHAAALSAAGDSLYAGSSLGGVWKGDLAGNGWRPLSDNLFGGAHGLAVAAGPPETITRITDDGLVHYTDDGGQTWHVPDVPPDNITAARRVLPDPSDPNRIYLVLHKTAGDRTYRSDDGGRTYTRIRLTPFQVSDLWIDRQLGGRLWLAEAGSFLKSDDLGATWDPVGSFPVAPTGIVLTGSEAGAPDFYAALQSAGQWNLYRSTDAGATWSFRHAIDDFWETLAASITDPDLVLFGGTELWRSTDGGGSFAKVNGWGDYYADPVHKLHADLPGLDFVWTSGGAEILYIGTDGGLYRSDDGAATVTNVSLSYLGVSQYYGTLTSANDPDLIQAGAQDQGYQRSTGPAVGSWRDFTQLISGDYGHLTSGDGTHGRVFSVYPGFVLMAEGEAGPGLDQLPFPASENHSWMPYILADPDNLRDFWFCATHLHRYHVGTHGAVITPGAQDFTVAGGAYLTALAISPVDHARRIAVTNTGVLWYSTDGGATWLRSPDSGPSSHYFYGTALEFSPTVAGEVYAGGSGYGVPGVYRTTDGGVTWTPAAAGLPSTLVYDLAFEGTGSDVLYAATEAGPYRWTPQDAAWTSLDDADVPLTTFWCVEAVPAGGVMRFGTYGRGIWDWQTEAAAVSAGDLVASMTPSGLRLSNAPNPFTARTVLSYTLPRAGEVRLRVHDTAGRLVRQLAAGTLPAGRHETEWDGRNDAGRPVAAGIYLVRLETPAGAAVRRITRLR